MDGCNLIKISVSYCCGSLMLTSLHIPMDSYVDAEKGSNGNFIIN